MKANDLLNSGPLRELSPEGDEDRQAIDSLRGYAYQVFAASIALIDLEDIGRIFLEVAEDFATVAASALQAVQVKDTASSGSVSLNSDGIRGAIAAFVDLVERNPGVAVYLRYFTTSEVGTERALKDRPAGIAGLHYWRRVASTGDVAPLRRLLKKHEDPRVRAFVNARDDVALRRELLARIHWDCGKPDLSGLRKELEERLVVLGRDRFSIPAQEATRLANTVACRVLRASVEKLPQNRVLTRADLYNEIDKASRLWIPRSAFDTLSQLASAVAGSLSGSEASVKAVYSDLTTWLVDGVTPPAPRLTIARKTLESSVAGSLDQFGTCVVVGGSGLGKTNVSRAAALATTTSFAVADFRDVSTEEARHRIYVTLARVDRLATSALIIEDLNNLDDPRVSTALGSLIEALRRRDRGALITCYRKPTARALVDCGLSPDCVVECPYFSQEEVNELVRINGGEIGKWAPLAYLAGAGGHPQLTHAFVVGVASRGWPLDEIRGIVNRGVSTEDIDATRDAARRSVAAALPDGARNLLYRLSLTVARFNRSFAMELGGVPPAVPLAGEHFDNLVGPWIEALGNDSYRVSPLARTFGHEMLTSEEQILVHHMMAVQLLRKRVLDPSDVDVILVHGLAGKAARSLAILARGLLTTDSGKLTLLGDSTILLRSLRTDAPIYPQEPMTSSLLRLAQYRLIAARNETEKTSEVATALLTEMHALPDGMLKRLHEGLVLGSILGTIGVASFLPNWTELLHRLKVLMESESYLAGLKSKYESRGGPERVGGNFLAGIFGIGIANLSSVGRLERIVEDLDKLDPAERSQWLTPVDKSVSDYSLFVSTPWVAEARSGTLNALEAAQRYKRMANRIARWDLRPLLVQCWVARAVLIDEYANDPMGALAVLTDAEASVGTDPVLVRARAKVHWRRNEHATALALLRDIADQIGRDNHIERAFALREAAISAAKCGDWEQAEKWFLDAQGAAREPHTADMRAMAIGLGADSAVAALENGRVESALTGFAGALEALHDLDPDGSLKAAYCHRAVRHAVLWAKSKIEGSSVRIGKEPIAVPPGTCSNPEPLPAIRELPLTHLDSARYMLAEAEIVSGVDVGIASSLTRRLAGGSIAIMEINVRTLRVQTSIDHLDAPRFAENFPAYIEGMVHLHSDAGRLRETDPCNPARSEVPALPLRAPYSPIVEEVARDAIVAFVIRAAISANTGAVPALSASLTGVCGPDFPGRAPIDHWAGVPSSLYDLDKEVLDRAKPLVQGNHPTPRTFWLDGLRFLERIDRSNFKRFLLTSLAKWQRAGWTRITTTEAFRLQRPRHTVPVIAAALDAAGNDRRFLAQLLLASEEAVGSPLAQSYRDRLRAMAAEGSESSATPVQ